MTARRVVLLAWAVQLAACAPGFSRVTPRELLRDEDLGLAFLRGDHREAGDFSEQIVLRAALEGGGRLHARWLVTNLAGADGRAQLSVTVHDGQGRRLAWSHKASREDWSAARGRLEVTFGEAPPAGLPPLERVPPGPPPPASPPPTRAGPWARLAVGVGWATLEVADPEAGLRLSATLRGPAQALQPEGGARQRGSQRHVTLIPVPRGALAVAVSAPSEAWRRAEGAEPQEGDAPEGADQAGLSTAVRAWQDDGIGYVEQRYGDIPPYALARSWFNVVSLGEEVSLVLSASEAPPPQGEPGAVGPARASRGLAGETRGWLFAANDDGLLLYAPVLEVRAEGFRPDPETGYELPEVVRIASPPLGLRGVFALGPLGGRTDDLASLSRLERLVVRRFMQPWTFRFARARWLLRQQQGLEAARDLRGEGTFLFQQVRP